MSVNYEEIHRYTKIVDGHCDTLLDLYNNKRSFWDINEKGHVDWQRLKKGSVNLQFLAIYIEPLYKPYPSLSRVLEILDYYHSLKLTTILYKEEVSSLSSQETKFLLTVEGGEVLEGKIGVLRILFKLGFRSLTLTWNQRNQLGDGVWEKASRGGLTLLGRQVIEEMNTLGMLIDVSHLSETGFWDVLEISKRPIAATHSCCRSLCDHPRNLTDTQLRSLGEKDGIVGINFYPGFLGPPKVNIDTVINHLEHAAAVAGIDHVGLGSDFDGIDKTPQGLESAAQLPYLTERMLKRGWNTKDIGKVLGGNFIRVLEQVLPSKTS